MSWPATSPSTVTVASGPRGAAPVGTGGVVAPPLGQRRQGRLEADHATALRGGRILHAVDHGRLALALDLLLDIEHGFDDQGLRRRRGDVDAGPDPVLQ